MTGGQYRAVRLGLLDDPRFQKLTAPARLVYVALTVVFGPSGIEVRYRQALPHELAPRTGLTVPRVRACLIELEEGGWIRWEEPVLWIVQQLSGDPVLSPNVPNHRKAVQNHAHGLPDCALVQEFKRVHAKAWFPDTIPDAMADAIPDAMAKASGSGKGRREEGRGNSEEGRARSEERAPSERRPNDEREAKARSEDRGGSARGEEPRDSEAPALASLAGLTAAALTPQDIEAVEKRRLGYKEAAREAAANRPSEWDEAFRRAREGR